MFSPVHISVDSRHMATLPTCEPQAPPLLDDLYQRFVGITDLLITHATRLDMLCRHIDDRNEIYALQTSALSKLLLMVFTVWHRLWVEELEGDEDCLRRLRPVFEQFVVVPRLMHVADKAATVDKQIKTLTKLLKAVLAKLQSEV